MIFLKTQEYASKYWDVSIQSFTTESNCYEFLKLIQFFLCWRETEDEVITVGIINYFSGVSSMEGNINSD